MASIDNALQVDWFTVAVSEELSVLSIIQSVSLQGLCRHLNKVAGMANRYK